MRSTTPARSARLASSAPTFLISIAAPAYLKRIGQLSGRETGLSVASVLLLLVPAVGSVYPVPSWPVNIFPYIFLAYLAIGMVWFMVLRRRPDFVEDVKRRVHLEHGTAGEIRLTPAAVQEPKGRALA